MSKLNIKVGNDIWDNTTGIVLIPVNCVGVMGCGLAKDCKERYPYIYRHYRKLCKAGEFKLTTLKFYMIEDNYAILLVPTKYDWKNPSKLEWVESILEKLGTCISRSPLDTYHVPPLGCGAGGLSTEDVQPLVEKYLCKDNVIINFYKH